MDMTRIKRAVPFGVTAVLAVLLSVVGGRMMPDSAAPIAPAAPSTPVAQPTASYAPNYAPTYAPSATVPPLLTAPATATARIVYIKQTAVPLPPLPTYTPPPRRESIWKEGDCWYLDLYGVREVWIDGRPVAPAHGGTRACGETLTIR